DPCIRWFESSHPSHNLYFRLHFLLFTTEFLLINASIPHKRPVARKRSKVVSMPNNLMVFSGNANPELAHKVAKWLGVPLGRADGQRFSDREISVELRENVRGQDVFIIQPTRAPTDDSLMELLLMADALHRSSATRITAVVPYVGCARQDPRVRSARVP